MMVYRDGIGNLEDLLVLINEECGNVKGVADCGELIYLFHTNVECRLRLSGKT